jgi:hypothetical protein
MPDTPLCYLQKGQKDGAQASLQWLRERNYDAGAELQEILESYLTLWVPHRLLLGTSVLNIQNTECNKFARPTRNLENNLDEETHITGQ